MCTAVEETNIEAILAVMNTTELVVKIRSEKIQVRTGFQPMTFRYRCNAPPTELTG